MKKAMLLLISFLPVCTVIAPPKKRAQQPTEQRAIEQELATEAQTSSNRPERRESAASSSHDSESEAEPIEAPEGYEYQQSWQITLVAFLAKWGGVKILRVLVDQERQSNAQTFLSENFPGTTREVVTEALIEATEGSSFDDLTSMINIVSALNLEGSIGQDIQAAAIKRRAEIVSNALIQPRGKIRGNPSEPLSPRSTENAIIAQAIINSYKESPKSAQVSPEAREMITKLREHSESK